MKKTLYVSDLDGTLLRRDQTISPFTAQTIRALTEKGMLFSYATARSIVTAGKVTRGLSVNIPVITYNGAFVVESETGKRLISHVFSKDEATRILNACLCREIMPIVFSLADGKEQFRYLTGKESRGAKAFLAMKKEDFRRRPVLHEDALYEGEIFHITCIDEKEKLAPLYEEFKEEMKKQGYPLFEISAATGKGVNELMKAAFSELQKLPPIQIYEPEMDIDEGFFVDTTEKGFEISMDEDVFVVSGSWIEAVGGSVNFSDEESLQYFQRALKNRGVIDALADAGIQEGDTVRIGDLEFDFVW